MIFYSAFVCLILITTLCGSPTLFRDTEWKRNSEPPPASPCKKGLQVTTGGYLQAFPARACKWWFGVAFPLRVTEQSWRSTKRCY